MMEKQALLENGGMKEECFLPLLPYSSKSVPH